MLIITNLFKIMEGEIHSCNLFPHFIFTENLRVVENSLNLSYKAYTIK